MASQCAEPAGVARKSAGISDAAERFAGRRTGPGEGGDPDAVRADPIFLRAYFYIAFRILNPQGQPALLAWRFDVSGFNHRYIATA
jgi:hypothetical protein